MLMIETTTLTLDLEDMGWQDADIEYEYHLSDPEPSVGLPNGEINDVKVTQVELVNHKTGARLDITDWADLDAIAEKCQERITVDA